MFFKANRKLLIFATKNCVRYLLNFIVPVLLIASCSQINVYEKLVTLPDHQWKKNQLAVIKFDIKDSTNHQLFLVVRHTERFPYNKLQTKLTIQDTSKKEIQTIDILAPLTDSAGAWSGERMDDIYYTRVKINPKVFLKPGKYRFVLENQMKQNPLPYIFNVGIALDH